MTATTPTITQAQASSIDATASNSTTKFNLRSAILVTAIGLLAGVTLGYNIFYYPYFQDGEGANMAKAYSMIEEGSLSPYTYDYEEAPFGSLMLTAWTEVVGGLDAFGFSGNTGRVLMLIVHVATAMLIFGIVNKVTNSDLAATLAALIFVFSPLVIVLQRRVLLENMMLLWLMASVYSIVGPERHLTHYFISALFYALAVLTRGAAIFFLPAFVYIVGYTADGHHRIFARNLWLTMAVALISLYPLYAGMRLELFPQGWWFFSGDYPHVSLWERIIDRGPETGRFLNVGSGLLPSLELWTSLSNAGADPMLIYGGGILAIFVVLMSIEQKALRPIIALLMAYIVYLLIGGQVVHSDVTPLLPLLAMMTGIAIGGVVRWTINHVPNTFVKLAVGLVVLTLLTYPFVAFYSTMTYLYTSDQTTEQLVVIDWVRENVPEEDLIATDNFAFVELRDEFPNVHNYWKTHTDPDIQLVLDYNWCSIDWIITSPQLLEDVQAFDMWMMKGAIENSFLLRTYENGGWPIEVRQVNKATCDVEVANS
jgi:4-amino-4-deoxy-L-arabinose transferase-like glycosyltransferase